MKRLKLLGVAALAALLVLCPLSAPAMQMATGSYTGNGGDDRSITGVGFQPDLVIVKGDTTETAVWRSSTMAAGESAYFDGGANFADAIQDLEVDGFQVGTHATVNSNTLTYYYIAFRDNGDADFHVGTYPGDGNDDRSITSVGFQPNMVFVKRDGAADAVWRPSSLAGDLSLLFSDSAAQNDNIQALEADGFQVGTRSKVNNNGDTYHYAAFKTTADEFAVGTYAGDGNDDRSITGVGFQPDYLWVKDDVDDYAVHRSDTVSGDATLGFDNVANAADAIQELKSDGFEVGQALTVNENGTTYYYAAWKIPAAAAAYPVGAATLIVP